MNVVSNLPHLGICGSPWQEESYRYANRWEAHLESKEVIQVRMSNRSGRHHSLRYSQLIVVCEDS